MKKNVLKCILLALLSSSSMQAQNWQGTINSDWATAGNWNNAAVPTAADNVNVLSAGPVVSTTGAVAKNLWIRGGTATATIADGGSLTVAAGGDIRVGAFNAGSANLFVNGGTLTDGGILYIAQDVNGAGSKLTLNSGTINANGSLRNGFSSNGNLEINGGTLNTSDLYVAQNTGSAGSAVDILGGTVSTSSNIFLGYGDTAIMRIMDDDASINVGNVFEFGRNGAPTLEFVLTADGTTSAINVGNVLRLNQLATGLTRTLTIDGSLVTDPQSITGTVLFASANAFDQATVDTLNSELNLVGLSGYNLALANGGLSIAVVPEPSACALLMGLATLFLIKRRRFASPRA